MQFWGYRVRVAPVWIFLHFGKRTWSWGYLFSYNWPVCDMTIFEITLVRLPLWELIFHEPLEQPASFLAYAGFPTGVKNMGGGCSPHRGALQNLMGRPWVNTWGEGGGASKERENILLLSLTQKNICNLIGWEEYSIGRICTLFSIFVLFY